VSDGPFDLDEDDWADLMAEVPGGEIHGSAANSLAGDSPAPRRSLSTKSGSARHYAQLGSVEVVSKSDLRYHGSSAGLAHFAGMSPREVWEATPVHQASTYSCGRCGQRFPDPHAVYEHLEDRCDAP